MSTLHIAGLSDVGKRYPANHDRWLVDAHAGLAILSDGMGEAVTPQYIMETLPAMLNAAVPPATSLDAAEVAPAVRQAVVELNRRSHQEAPLRGDITGATLVITIVRGHRLLVAHLGDSRAYRCREGELERLTIDHSMVQRMVEQGWITPDEAARTRGNGGPTRFVGKAGEAQADVQVLGWLPDDRLLLCSDGLTEMLSDEQLKPLMAGAPTPEEVCRDLIQAALNAGGDDNITAVVVFADQDVHTIAEDALLP